MRETRGGGFSPGEIHDIADTIGEMSESSAHLATLLQTHGNHNQVTLGQQLQTPVRDLAQLTGAPKAD